MLKKHTHKGKFIEYNRRKLELNGYDLPFMAHTQPEGNIKVHSGYIEIGNCFVAFLDVYGYPKNNLPFFWLSDLVNQENVISFLSTNTANISSVKPDLNRALTELWSRKTDTKLTPSDQMDASIDEQQLDELYAELNSNSETLKNVFLRLMVYDTTLDKLYSRIDHICHDFYAFKISRFIDEQEYEMSTMYMPVSRQTKLANHRKPKLMTSYDLGGSYMFDYLNKNDPGGKYLGYTLTNGSFTFNPYNLQGKRTRVFSLVAGSAGQGKSTLLQMLNDDAFVRGNYIRNFDVSGEYRHSTKLQHGLIIDTSKDTNRVNMFEIFPTVTSSDGQEVDEIGSFNQNISKIKTIAHIMQPALSTFDMSILDHELTQFYIDRNMWVENASHHRADLKVLGLPHAQYPTLEEFIMFLGSDYDKRKNDLNSSQAEIQAIRNVNDTFIMMQSRYSDIFDGHTNIPDFADEKVVTFDMSSVKAMLTGTTQDQLFQAQFFSYLSLISSQVVINGKRYRDMIRNGQITDDKLGFNVDFYYINIDEAEDYFKPEFPDVVGMLANIMEEMRKNFCAITFAFPTLKDILISDKNTQYNAYVRSVGKMFGLFQYFHFFNLPANDVEALKEYFRKNSSVTVEQLDTVQNMDKYEVLTVIAGEGSYRWHTEPTKEQIKRYI